MTKINSLKIRGLRGVREELTEVDPIIRTGQGLH